MISRLFKTNAWTYALAGALLGAILFLCIYGFAPLSPGNVALMYDSDDIDIISYQLGFDFYRAAPWSLPPGSNPSYPYPLESSILYSDSIPLLAIPCKLLSPLLPDDFQYFGLWTFACFLLQGASAALLLRRLRVPLPHAALASTLYICNVPLLFRCFHHCALCGQWLLLLAFLGALYQRQMTQGQRLRFWASLCTISILVAVYLFVMVGMIMTAVLLYDLVRSRRAVSAAAAVPTVPHRVSYSALAVWLLSALCSILAFFLAGGFLSSGSASKRGLGTLSLDLLAPLNPGSFSSFLPALPSSEANSEQALYLGLGILLLLFCALLLGLYRYRQLRDFGTRHRGALLAIFCFSLFLCLLAIGPSLTIGGHTLWDASALLPPPLYQLLSTFRALSRFFLPVWYLLLTAAVALLSRALPRRSHGGILLALIAVLQYADVVPPTARGGIDTVTYGYPTAFSDAFDGVFTEDAQHLSMITMYLYRAIPPAVYAAHHGMTINTSAVARGRQTSIRESIAEWDAAALRRDTVYVLPIQLLYYVQPAPLPEDFLIYYCDDYFCVFSASLLARAPSGDSILLDHESFYELIRQSHSFAPDAPIITEPADVDA